MFGLQLEYAKLNPRCKVWHIEDLGCGIQVDIRDEGEVIDESMRQRRGIPDSALCKICVRRLKAALRESAELIAKYPPICVED